jgi:hypothetical protein
MVTRAQKWSEVNSFVVRANVEMVSTFAQLPDCRNSPFTGLHLPKQPAWSDSAYCF